MKTIRDVDIKNKRVFVRCDFNVPVDKKGNIENDFRIRQTLPTLEYILKKGGSIVLASHFSGGELDLVWERVKHSIGENNISFLENLRLNKGEEENSDEFAKELAALADIYVNDAFGVCHRNHASVVKITEYLPSFAGFLLEKEVEVLNKVMENPETPFVAVIGGVKFESKSKVIERFLEKADYVLVGGKIGLSDEVRMLSSEKLILPTDNVDGFDIGPRSIKDFCNIIKKAKTIVWAGPVGYFEKHPYDKGTEEIGKEIIKNKQCFKVAGGGDTINAVFNFKLEDGFDHLSTGGGAMLDFIAEKELPGIKALK